MHVTSLGLHTDLFIRQLSGSTVDDRGDHLVVRTPENPTFRWGNFLVMPTPLQPGDGARWDALFAELFPAARYRAYGIDGTDGAAGDPTEVAKYGLRAETNTVLSAAAQVVGASSAPGVVCRRLVSDDDWTQSLALRIACDDGTEDPDEHRVFVERKLLAERAMDALGAGGWFGAVVDGIVVARLGIFGDRSGIARYQDVETHPQYRRRGLARALLAHAARFAVDTLGTRTVVIVADPGYHAIDLYRSVGFDVTEQTAQLEVLL